MGQGVVEQRRGHSPSPARVATSPMIRAVSAGRDHIGQWLVGRSIQVDVAQLAEPGEERRRGILLRVLLVVRGAEPGRDDRRRDVVAGVVRERVPFPEQAGGLRHGAFAEGGELLLGEAVEVLLRLDLVPDHRLLVALEPRIEGALAGCRVDVHDRRDPLRDDVAGGIAREAGRAVERQHRGRRSRAEGPDDRVDVVRERDAGTVGVLRLEPGQREGGDVVAVGPQQRGDLVPRPRAEPEARDQDDRCARHVVAPPVPCQCAARSAQRRTRIARSVFQRLGLPSPSSIVTYPLPA